MRRAWFLFLLLLTTCAAPRDRIVLLGADPGEELTVTTGQGTTTLSSPETTATVTQAGRIALGTLATAALQARYGELLGSLPERAASYTFYFQTGQTSLDAQGRDTLADLLAEVQRRDVVEVEVMGHTDQQGSEAVNDRLSLARAEAVRLLLWQGGLTATFVRVVGRGSRQPLVDLPGQADKRNRRVEVRVR